MKSSKDINLETYNLSLITAKEDVLNPRTSTNWALFAYDGVTNRLKLADSGVGGVSELVSKLHPRRPFYGLCRVDRPNTAQTHIAMVIWVGKDVDGYRRDQCAAHVPAIKSFFKEVHFFLPASSLEDVTEERIFTLSTKVAEMMERERGRRVLRQEDKEETVGTNYKRTIAAAEIRKTHRENFWAQSEREEEERKEEERRRATDDRRRRERERVQQEKREAEEREKRMNEKLKKIQEQRWLQAQAEAEKHKQEQLKWAQQQQEFEDEMKCRSTHSESVEKAAEAAVLVSQRRANPREFFRQLSLSSLSSSTHQRNPPSSPQTARSPNRKFLRSLTDAFTFIKSSSSSPSPPCSPNPLSPFLPSTPTPHSPTAPAPNIHTPPASVSPSISPFTSTQQSPTVVSPSPPCGHTAESLSHPCGQTMVSQLPPSGQTVVEIPESSLFLQPSSPVNQKTSLTDIVESFHFYPRPLQPAADFNTQSLDQSECEISAHPQSHSSNSVTQSPVCNADQSDSQITTQVQSGISSPQSLARAPSRPLPALPTRESSSQLAVVSTETEGEREKDDGEKEQMGGKEDEEKAEESRREGKEEKEEVPEAWVTAQASMISIAEEEGGEGEMREEDEEEKEGETNKEEIREKEGEDKARDVKDGEKEREEMNEVEMREEADEEARDVKDGEMREEEEETVKGTKEEVKREEAEEEKAKEGRDGGIKLEREEKEVGETKQEEMREEAKEEEPRDVKDGEMSEVEDKADAVEGKVLGERDAGEKREEEKLEVKEKDLEPQTATQASMMPIEEVDGEKRNTEARDENKEEKEDEIGEAGAIKERGEEEEAAEEKREDEKNDGKEREAQASGVKQTTDEDVIEGVSDEIEKQEEGEEERTTREEISARTEGDEQEKVEERKSEGEIQRKMEQKEGVMNVELSEDEKETNLDEERTRQSDTDWKEKQIEVEESIEAEDAAIEEVKNEVENKAKNVELHKDEREAEEDRQMEEDRKEDCQTVQSDTHLKEKQVEVEESTEREDAAIEEVKNEVKNIDEERSENIQVEEVEETGGKEAKEEGDGKKESEGVAIGLARGQEVDKVKDIEDTVEESKPTVQDDNPRQTEPEELANDDVLEAKEEIAEVLTSEVQPCGLTNTCSHSESVQESKHTVPGTFCGESSEEHKTNTKDTSEEFASTGNSTQNDSADGSTPETEPDPVVSDHLSEALADSIVATILESLPTSVAPSLTVSPSNTSKISPDLEDLLCSISVDEAPEAVSKTEEACEEAKETEESEGGESAEEDCEPAEWHTAELKTRNPYAETMGQLDCEDASEDTDYVTSIDSNQLSSEADPVQEMSDVEDGQEAFSESVEDKASYDEEAQEPEYDSDGVEEATEHAFLPASDVNIKVMDTMATTDIANKIKDNEDSELVHIDLDQ